MSNFTLDTATLVRLYRVQVRPVWECAQAFWLTTPTRVQEVQRLQNKFLRLALPTARSTDVRSLHVLCNVALVEERLKFLAAKFVTRLAKVDTYHPCWHLRQHLRELHTHWCDLSKVALLRS